MSSKHSPLPPLCTLLYSKLALLVSYIFTLEYLIQLSTFGMLQKLKKTFSEVAACVCCLLRQNTCVYLRYSPFSSQLNAETSHRYAFLMTISMRDLDTALR